MKTTTILRTGFTAALLLSLLVSCGDTAGTAAVTTADPVQATSAVTEAVTEEGYPAPDFTGLDFGGEELRFASPNWSVFTYYFPEEMTGESLDDAAYMRIANVQNKLNVKIVNTYDEYGANIQDIVKQSIQAGDDAFDIVFTHCIFGIGDYATGNMLYNLDKLPNLNLENPWWNQEITDTFRIGTENPVRIR